jgi:uncharacterized cupredoxin-like copper-binding protein
MMLPCVGKEDLMRRSRAWAALAVAVSLAATFAACSDDGGSNAGGTSSPTPKGSTTVAVTLQEFAVLPQQPSAQAGSVTFAAENKGPNDKHELVVVKTDLDPTSLPKKADGSVDETGAGVTLIGEIEEFAPGETKQVTFDLTAGKYVLFCNVVDTEKTPPEVHYQLGMRAGFTVV